MYYGNFVYLLCLICHRQKSKYYAHFRKLLKYSIVLCIMFRSVSDLIYVTAAMSGSKKFLFTVPIVL